jgi:serine/threonine-protein kinase 11
MSDKPLLERQSTSSRSSNVQAVTNGTSIFSNPLLSKHLTEVTYKTNKRTKQVGDYLLGYTLGSGSFSKVREAINTKNNRMHAVKVLKKRNLKRIPLGEESVMKEINILKQLHHPNCIQFFTHHTDPETGTWYIVLEYVRGGSLAQLIHRSPKGILPLSQARKIFSQLLDALEYLHSLGIYHKDIKPDNILLTEKGIVKLSDFNSAVDCKDEKSKKGFGCPAFQPPEITSGNSQTANSKTDIWQAGITLYMMVVGKYPFEGSNFLELADNICNCSFNIPSSLDAALSDLLGQILTPDPEQRLSIPQIRNHPWMHAELPNELPIPVKLTPSLFKQAESKTCCTII